MVPGGGCFHQSRSGKQWCLAIQLFTALIEIGVIAPYSCKLIAID
jgi:hypothetical protein